MTGGGQPKASTIPAPHESGQASWLLGTPSPSVSGGVMTGGGQPWELTNGPPAVGQPSALSGTPSPSKSGGVMTGGGQPWELTNGPPAVGQPSALSGTPSPSKSGGNAGALVTDCCWNDDDSAKAVPALVAALAP